MTYFAIQDKEIGFIQYVTDAPSEAAALEAFDESVGIDPNGAGLSVADWIITELTAEQYARLADCDGQDQEAIDFLESLKYA